jgi:hypothetical protein
MQMAGWSRGQTFQTRQFQDIFTAPFIARDRKIQEDKMDVLGLKVINIHTQYHIIYPTSQKPLIQSWFNFHTPIPTAHGSCPMCPIQMLSKTTSMHTKEESTQPFQLFRLSLLLQSQLRRVLRSGNC